MLPRSVRTTLFCISAFLVCLPSARADYINLTFQGAVTSSSGDHVELFGGVVAGDAVTGFILIDLALSARRSTDYEVPGDAYYNANDDIGPERFITSQINVGDHRVVLGHSPNAPYDEESVWMFRHAVFDDVGPRDFLAIQDEYYYETDEGVSSFDLNFSMIDAIDSFLSSLDLDQEFQWTDSPFPHVGASGTLAAEADVGIGSVNFQLHDVQATRVPTVVSEPAPFGIVLAGLLMMWAQRRRGKVR